MELPIRLKNFFTFYILAFLLHYTEGWGHPYVVSIFTILAFVVFASDFRPIWLLVFSLAVHYRIFGYEFPSVANHTRVFVGCNLAVTFFAAALVFRRKPDNEGSKIVVGFPTCLMLALAMTYFFAGFHKLNWGFFQFEHSCATDFAHRFLQALGFGDVGIPPAVFPIAVGFVFLWELLVPVLLLFRRTQWIALPVCIGMHWLLAPSGFLDFSSLAWAILSLFLSDRYHEAIEESPLRIAGRSFGRRDVYFYLTLAGGWLAGFHLTGGLALFGWLPKGVETFTGLLFVMLSILFLWPALCLIWRERKFHGRAIRWRSLHWVYSIPLALLFLNGFQPYLGLSTGGAFSMFSNLRTEGSRSNHLLLGDNPFKLFAFQEDVVEIIEAPSDAVDHDVNIAGHDVPMVKLRQILARWKAGNQVIPLTFNYQGKQYSSEDICADPDWQLKAKWYDRFLDFRVIPREGPNCCQW